jgi:hypothetical protein
MVSCAEIVGNVVALAPITAQDLVFATETAVFRLSGGELRRYEGGMPLAIAGGPEGDLWVAPSPMAGAGVARFDGTEWFTETLPVDVITSLVVGPEGEVFAGAGQVFRREPSGGWAAIGDAGAAVRLLRAGSGGDVWALARSRILRLQGDRWEVAFDAGELIIHTFAPGEDGMLWLGTSVGVVQVELDG